MDLNGGNSCIVDILIEPLHLSVWEKKGIQINSPSSSKSRRKASSLGILGFFLFLALVVLFLGAILILEENSDDGYS